MSCFHITIYLMRHGSVFQHEPRRFLGQRDVSLSAEGKASFLAWRPLLPRLNCGYAVRSDLLRCAQSADALDPAGTLCFRQDARLREIALGQWEGLTVEEVQERFPGEYAARGSNLPDFVPVGGESFRQAQIRALAALSEHSGNAWKMQANVLVLAHFGILASLVVHALGVSLEHILDCRLDYASCHILRFDGRSFSVAAQNVPPGEFSGVI